MTGGSISVINTLASGFAALIDYLSILLQDIAVEVGIRHTIRQL